MLQQQLDRIDTESASDRAFAQALDNAIVHALFLAHQAFLAEVAQTCLINEPMKSLLDLEHALQAKGSSHAVVESLRSLADKPSWFSYLLNENARLIDRSHRVQIRSPVFSALINLADVSESYALNQVVIELEQFINNQREFLQEW